MKKRDLKCEFQLTEIDKSEEGEIAERNGAKGATLTNCFSGHRVNCNCHEQLGERVSECRLAEGQEDIKAQKKIEERKLKLLLLTTVYPSASWLPPRLRSLPSAPFQTSLT